MIWLRPTTVAAHRDDLRAATVIRLPVPRPSWMRRALRWCRRVVLKYMGCP